MDASLIQSRLEHCGSLMKAEQIDVLLLTKPANLFYLAGDGRLCAYALITRAGEVALGVPSTDVEDARQQAHFQHLVGFEDEVGMIHSIAHYFEQFGLHQGMMGLEYSFLTQAMMGIVTHPHAKPAAVEWCDATPILAELRTVKDPFEIDCIHEAARVADAAMDAAVCCVRPGISESQIAAEAEYTMRQAGAESFWPTYVASGPRTNVAHGLPTHRKIEPGDLVTIDIHPIVAGYSADICRTVCAGEPTAEQANAYDLYLAAQQAAIARARAGVEIADLEARLHASFEKARHGAHIFGPPIHGVGIEFEEAPLPAGHAFFHGAKAPSPLQANTVIAIGNCGLYTGPWGVRVEDTVVVGAEKPRTLTTFPRSLRVE